MVGSYVDRMLTAAGLSQLLRSFFLLNVPVVLLNSLVALLLSHLCNSRKLIDSVSELLNICLDELVVYLGWCIEPEGCSDSSHLCFQFACTHGQISCKNVVEYSYEVFLVLWRFTNAVASSNVRLVPTKISHGRFW